MADLISKKAKHGIDISKVKLELNNGVISIFKNDKLATTLSVHANCVLKMNDAKTHVHVYNSSSLMHAGTDFSNLFNIIQGLNTPFVKFLLVRGSGYKVTLTSDTLTLFVGFSHTTIVKIPSNIQITIDPTRKATGKATLICLKCVCENLNDLTAFMTKIEKINTPDPYKGNGIAIDGKFYVRKDSKKGGK